MSGNEYTVRRTIAPIVPDGDFYTAECWKHAEILSLDHRLLDPDASSVPEHDFVPDVKLKLLYDKEFIYGTFLVKDQYVRVVTPPGYQRDVCTDSCVEIFIRPAKHLRYFNFEFSAGGAMLLYNITHLRSGHYTPVEMEDCRTVKIYHSLPERVEPEITTPLEWRLSFAIPVRLFSKYGEALDDDLAGQVWTANVSNCADHTSHPHWLSWQPLSKLDFHLPDEFGTLIFES